MYIFFRVYFHTGNMSSAIQRALVELNLQIFQIKIFKDDRIEDDTFQHLTDQDLIRLGVETIGDRIRLREAMRKTL